MAENYPEVVAGVLIYNSKNEIFLAKCHKWKDKWVVPGGHLEIGETFNDCVKREVKEETNIDVDNIELVCIQESVFSEEFHQKRHMIFLDFAAKAVSKEIKLNKELQEYKWITAKKALTLELNSSTRKFIKEFIKIKCIGD
ncbi:MAG: NUDIX domain-containing protein [Candidatus Aenigmarchaeota archaeon]|nr:NUDIX domain-containing protein [Candidatus Aenigmarchaeota archaeon]